MPETILVRFHSHLRLADHPALSKAADRAERILPVYVSERRVESWPPGANKRRWRERSLRRLADRLETHDLPLVFRTGHASEVIPTLADDIDADAVYWNRRVRPDHRRRDEAAADRLREQGCEVETFGSRILHDPEAVETTSGGPYHVYTPFWNKFLKVVDIESPLPAPDLDDVSGPETTPDSEPLDDLAPDEVTAPEFDDWWTPGEEGARERLDQFTDEAIGGYDKGRDEVHADGTSRISPYLQHGEVTPRQVWEAVGLPEPPEDADGDDRVTFLQEIVWREFAYHLLHHYPETDREPLKDKFRDFQWREDSEALERWKHGETGFPIVDAGMRQLKKVGWMHNRARMIVGSFLTKDLQIHWSRGAEWFWHHLVDADLASNTMGWQWAAGTGADAQPFFRIFNPVSQGERHDPEGEYVRRYVPELADLPDEHLHAPWEAPDQVLSSAGVELDGTYPSPMVDHSEAREAALEEWRRIK
jgi:deoxyribodipyrimidine photo-lyase